MLKEFNVILISHPYQLHQVPQNMIQILRFESQLPLCEEKENLREIILRHQTRVIAKMQQRKNCKNICKYSSKYPKEVGKQQ